MKIMMKKSFIRETKNLSTDADIRTDTILERLRDLSQFIFLNERMRNFSLKKIIMREKPQKTNRKARENPGKAPADPLENLRKSPGKIQENLGKPRKTLGKSRKKTPGKPR